MSNHLLSVSGFRLSEVGRLDIYCLNHGFSRMIRMTRILRVFRFLTRYLKHDILLTLLFNLLLLG